MTVSLLGASLVHYIRGRGLLSQTPYEGHNLANQICRKLRVFDRKLEESQSIFQCYFHKV